jgi:hypothetical protein
MLNPRSDVTPSQLVTLVALLGAGVEGAERTCEYCAWKPLYVLLLSEVNWMVMELPELYTSLGIEDPENLKQPSEMAVASQAMD